MIAIALKMLLGDRAKYFGLLFGITFTSFLVTFAASYFGGMMTRSFALIAESPADVWVMDPAVVAVDRTINLPRPPSIACAASRACFRPCLWRWRRRTHVFRTGGFNPCK